jgi:hypothetical protein
MKHWWNEDWQDKSELIEKISVPVPLSHHTSHLECRGIAPRPWWLEGGILTSWAVVWPHCLIYFIYSILVSLWLSSSVTCKLMDRSSWYSRPRWRGLVVACLPLDPRFTGSNPAEDNGFLRVIKICSMTSFGGEVKSSVPCRRFTAWKNFTSMEKMLCKQNSVAMFLTHVSPASLLDGSSRCIRIE